MLRQDDKEEYKEHHITNPNETFQECFQWFVDNFGDTDEPERERNRERMKKPWAMQDGWIRLTSQIESGRNYAHFCGKPISESDILDIAMTHILNTQIFAREYEEWKGFPPQYKNWTNFKRHWKSKMTLKKTTMKTTSSEMGLNASGTNAVDDEVYGESMKQFSTAYSATQGSIQNLTNTTVNMLPAIMQELQLQRQQNQMMAQAINMGTANQWSNNGGGNNGGGGGWNNNNQRGKKKKKNRNGGGGSNNWNGGSGGNNWNGGGNNWNGGGGQGQRPHSKAKPSSGATARTLAPSTTPKRARGVYQATRRTLPSTT